MRAVLIFLVIFICSCNPLADIGNLGGYDSAFSSSEGESLEEESSKTKEPYILLKASNQKINIFKFNRSKSVLNLSDQIFFPFISKDKEKARFYVFDKTKQEENFKVRVSSLCSSDVFGDKAVKEFFSFQNKSSFMFLNIIPEEVLISSEEKTFTCSFIFGFKDENKDIVHYIVTQQSIDSSGQGKGLALKNKINMDLNIHSSIGIENLDSIYLMRKDSQLSEDYQFICEDFVKGFSFQLKFLEDPFLHRIISQRVLPKGIKNCRIVSVKLGLIYGMTQLFKMNFDKLNLEEKQVDISKVSYEIINKGNQALTTSRKRYDSKYRISSYETAYSFSVVRFKGLPEDFSLSKHQDIQVKAHTICSNSLDSSIVEADYQFPLTEEFSLMSITPETFFQLYYSYDEKRFEFLYKRTDAWSWFYEKASKKDLKCTYKISLESYDSNDQTSVIDFPKTYRVLKLSSGNYGVSIDNTYSIMNLIYQKDKDNRGSDTSMEIKFAHKRYFSLKSISEGLSGRFDFVYLNQLANNNRDFLKSQPDQMTLKCGGNNDTLGTDFALNFFSIDRLGSSVSASFIFSHSSFLDYIYKKLMVKCRLLFYKNNILKYYSSELHIIKLKDSKF